MTTHHKEEKKEVTIKQWVASTISMLFVAFVCFACATVLRSYKTQELEQRLNKQDVINATISTSLVDIKDALNEIKTDFKK